LESALGQTHRDCEIIVVDDGSQDESLLIARSFADRGVRVVSQANQGAAAARNHGLRLATGDFIQFLDADDLLGPEKIARQLVILRDNPKAIASSAWGRFNADPAQVQFQPEINWTERDPVAWLCHNFAGRGMMPPIAWLTPRSLVERVGAWDERLSLNDDGEYFCRVLLSSETIHFCSEAKVFYRSQIAGSLSRRTSRQAWESALLSHDLCTSHLLARETSGRTRTACADLYQRLAYAMYPDCPDLVKATADKSHAIRRFTAADPKWEAC
jgi:glycosyltransferase involved in cell wall biosynthesis